MKKILFVIAAAVSAASAHASYLYWQINSQDLSSAGAPAEVQGVRIYASNDNGASKTYLDLGYADFDNDRYQSIGNAVTAPVGGTLLADVSGIGTDYSFYVELINNNVSTWSSSPSTAYGTSDFAGQLVSSGSDDPITYTALSQKGFIGADLSPVSMAVWHGGGAYSSVPEPTSAMLMLFGLAGLALRRRTV